MPPYKSSYCDSDEWKYRTKNQYTGPNVNDTSLYCHIWVEGGREHKGNMGSFRRASLGMKAKLSEGFPAWIAKVPYTDDDVPF